MNPCHAVTLDLSIIHFNSIPTCTSVSLKQYFPLRFLNCTFVLTTHVYLYTGFPASLIQLDLITLTVSDTRYNLVSPSLYAVF